MAQSIFLKIMSGEIPADILFEDDQCICIRDINPQAPFHVLVVPRKALRGVSDLTTEDVSLVGHLMMVCKHVANEAGFGEEGYRIVVNNGSLAGQTVDHLHVHVLAGRPMKWPPG